MNTKILTTAAVLAFSLSTGAQASLVARDGGMVYDDVNNITWAADANLAKTSGYDADGQMTWAAAVAWADQLTLGGYTDWSLPTTVTFVAGYNQTGSQMGDLFYNQLGGVSSTSIATTHNGYYNLFTNVQSSVYWLGTEFKYYTANAMVFGTDTGGQGNYNKPTELYAWAVRSGDVAAAAPAAVPLPAATWLFLSGLMGVVGLKRRKNIG